MMATWLYGMILLKNTWFYTLTIQFPYFFLQAAMEHPATDANDSSRWGHPQLLFVVAELLGRSISLVTPDPKASPMDEIRRADHVFTYTTGFAHAFGEPMQLDQLKVYSISVYVISFITLYAKDYFCTNYLYFQKQTCYIIEENYLDLFESPNRPDTLVLWWNNSDEYSPILLVLFLSNFNHFFHSLGQTVRPVLYCFNP